MRFHNDPGHYVAHYTGCDTAIDYILKNRTLRLGPFSATNDPRETKTWLFAIGTTLSKENTPTHDQSKALARRNADYDRLLKQGYKILCVSQDKENAWKLEITDRAYGKPRMWSQYAGNHTGVCLLFDKEVLNATIEERFREQGVFSGPVQYGNFHTVGEPGFMEHIDAFTLSANDLLQHGLEKTLQRHRDEHLQILFFRKDKDWEHESEYRWIVRGDSDDPEFIPIEGSLRAILLGIDFPMARLKDVYTYCQATDTSVSRIVWINGIPGVHWFQPSQLSAPEYKQALEMTGLAYCG